MPNPDGTPTDEERETLVHQYIQTQEGRAELARALTAPLRGIFNSGRGRCLFQVEPLPTPEEQRLQAQAAEGEEEERRVRAGYPTLWDHILE